MEVQSEAKTTQDSHVPQRIRPQNQQGHQGALHGPPAVQEERAEVHYRPPTKISSRPGALSLANQHSPGASAQHPRQSPMESQEKSHRLWSFLEAATVLVSGLSTQTSTCTAARRSRRNWHRDAQYAQVMLRPQKHRRQQRLLHHKE